MSKTIICIILGAIVGLLIGFFIFRPQLPVGMSEYNRFSNADTATVSVTTTTASEVLAAKGGRLYVRIDNPDGTNLFIVFLEQLLT